MNKTYKAVLELVKSAVTGEKVVLPDNTDWEMVIKIAKLHQIIPMIFYGLNFSGITTLYDEKLFEITAQNIIMEQEQLNAIKAIGDAFSSEGIDHAFLKGCRLKHLYPKTEMRVMGDLDILIKPQQYLKIKPIMEKLGFLEEKEWDNEYHWHKGHVHIELHKSLMHTGNGIRDLYDFFGVEWDSFIPMDDQPYRYEMSKEDELIFLLGHLIKHYRFSGIGIRPMVDIYVFLSKYDLNADYVEAQLKKLGVWEFYNNLVFTLGNWFENGLENEISQIITNRVITSGSYGTENNNAVAAAYFAEKREGSVGKARIKVFFYAAFLPLSKMKQRFPILHKAPILLPATWVARWILILFKPKNIKAQANRMNKYNAKTIKEFNDQLKKVGL